MHFAVTSLLTAALLATDVSAACHHRHRQTHTKLPAVQKDEWHPKSHEGGFVKSWATTWTKEASQYTQPPVAAQPSTTLVVKPSTAAPAVQYTQPPAAKSTTEKAAAPATTKTAAAPAASSASSGSSTDSSDQKGCLDAHNKARSEVDVGDLVWDSELEADALAYAKKLAAANAGLNHSTGAERPGQGENLYWYYDTSVTTPLINGANSWIAEKSSYTLGSGVYNHYTQVVWKATTKVAVASATAADGGVFVVGRYSIAGNLEGSNPY